MSAIIKCDNVSIRYITGDFKDIGIKEYLIRRLKGEYRVTEFWADRQFRLHERRLFTRTADGWTEGLLFP